jgi:hypothetical protein
MYGLLGNSKYRATYCMYVVMLFKWLLGYFSTSYYLYNHHNDHHHYYVIGFLGFTS